MLGGPQRAVCLCFSPLLFMSTELASTTATTTAADHSLSVDVDACRQVLRCVGSAWVRELLPDLH